MCNDLTIPKPHRFCEAFKPNRNVSDNLHELDITEEIGDDF